jgi:hypothetical protein
MTDTFNHWLLKSAIAAVVALSASSLFAQSLLPGDGFSIENKWAVCVAKPVADAGGKIELVQGKAVATIPDAESQTPNLMQISSPVELQANKSYVLKITVKCDKSGTLNIGYTQAGGKYAWYASANVKIEEGERNYECQLDVAPDKNGDFQSSRQIDFLIAGVRGAQLELSKISIEEKR